MENIFDLSPEERLLWAIFGKAPERENPLNIQKYIRRPFTVQAVQVTLENMHEVAEWCGGVVVKADRPENSYVKAKIAHPLNKRQTQAFAGDYVLKMGRGFKIYLEKAFGKTFIPADESARMFVDPVNN